MHCWKAINFSKQYGGQRIFILSSITMLFTFILLYIPITYFFLPETLNDNYFIFFLIGLLMLYPAHKILHYLPIFHLGKKVKKELRMIFGIIPAISIRVNEPVQRSTFIIALAMPFIVLNLGLLGACFLSPHYVHYFTILLAVHVGICVPDFICAKNILSAPAHSYIEENEDGFEILVIQQTH